MSKNPNLHAAIRFVRRYARYALSALAVAGIYVGYWHSYSAYVSNVATDGIFLN